MRASVDVAQNAYFWKASSNYQSYGWYVVYTKTSELRRHKLKLSYNNSNSGLS